MKSIIMLSALLFGTVPLARGVTVKRYSSTVVGYQFNHLNKGWNEIKVAFDEVGVFPAFTTMDKVITFTHGESMVGDEIVYNLDGYHQKYRIDGYDATKRKFTLTKVRKEDNIPERISLDWIPAPKVFWINHVTTNSVEVTQTGRIDNGLKKLLVDSRTMESNELTQSLIKITPVSTNSTTLRLTLQGGKIIQQR